MMLKRSMAVKEYTLLAMGLVELYLSRPLPVCVLLGLSQTWGNQQERWSRLFGQLRIVYKWIRSDYAAA